MYHVLTQLPCTSVDFHDLYISSDEKLFNKILTCPNHILRTLLPPPTAQNYSLRNRPHNRQLPDRISRITDCNFTVRMLYRNMYWLLYILDLHSVLFLCTTAVWQFAINEYIMLCYVIAHSKLDYCYFLTTTSYLSECLESAAFDRFTTFCRLRCWSAKILRNLTFFSLAWDLLVTERIQNASSCHLWQDIAPGAARRYAPPPMEVRRRQKSRRIYVRPRTGPQSAPLWWPAVVKLQAASVPLA